MAVWLWGCGCVLFACTAIVFWLGLRDAMVAADSADRRSEKLRNEIRLLQSQAPCVSRAECASRARQAEKWRQQYLDLEASMRQGLGELGESIDAIEIRPGNHHHYHGTWNCEARVQPGDEVAS